MKVPYDELCKVMGDVLLREGMEPDRADLCARLFADASRDGVASLVHWGVRGSAVGSVGFGIVEV